MSLEAHAAKYCLNEATNANKAKVTTSLSPYLKSGERIDWIGDCFTLPLSIGRDMLFQKIISDAASFTVGSDIIVSQRPCELELVEESSSQANGSRYEVRGSGQALIRNSKSESEGKTTSRLLLSSGRPGKLYVDETFLEVVCTLGTNPAIAEVQVWLIGNEGRAQISTTLTLSKGQRQFLGDVVKELKDKNRHINIPQGAGASKKSSNQKTSFYLVLN